ncbi:manganese catalase family protein [Acuticoccus mangrovi]|uniref:Manganese catalase family protein n=1 Tax=Acuticoccus mangrovi TaxID=2796142 RepID=A0A934INQ1_9HYPH|nr:manganese catalase family protein [Acuticoccus mangrovi]MBJ3775748.1 manganese catalase family protein [Acuticoccus mangrovi]
MFMRIDRLQVEMPVPKDPDPTAAAAVQELMGGRFGEMSTLMNYMFQSMNFRNKEKLKPYYALISNICTEELGHVELIAATVNGCLSGVGSTGDITQGDAGFAHMKEAGLLGQFINFGAQAMPTDSRGEGWHGSYVFNSGNLILDLLHNFFLENGARTAKLRVYQMTDNPAARQMLGYLFTRGGVHAHAYALALEKLTGVEMRKMLPIPAVEDIQLPESRKFMEEGWHRRLYRFSPGDYKDIAEIWTGNHMDGQPLEVVDGPPQGGDMNDYEGISEAFTPEYHPEEIFEMAQKLYKQAGGV